MFENRKPIPFFAKGPDPKRFYARDIKRWSITGGEGKEDGIKVKVEINSGWGRRETLATVAVPFIGFLLFGSICLAIRYFEPQNENVGWFFLCIVGICCLQIPLFAALTWFEVSYFNQLPAEVLTVYDNREFSIEGEKARRTLTQNSFLRYTIHYSQPDCQGGNSNSELDLVVREGDKEIAVHKLIAFQHNWCWKPAKKISALSGIPLKRVALQWNGEKFPPSLPS